MTALEVEAAFFAVSPAMLKILAVVIFVSIAIGVIQRFRYEVGA